MTEDSILRPEDHEAVEAILANNEIPLDVKTVFSQELIDTSDGESVFLKVYETEDEENPYIFVVEGNDGGAIADAANSAEILIERANELANDLISDGLFEYPSDDIAAADES